jgi:dihydroxyacetone kinase
LWGAGLSAVGHALNDGEQAAVAARAGLTAIRDLGGAQLGDKTMVDALAPFVDALTDELTRGASLARAWRRAVQVADERTDATRGLVSRRGRAALHAEHGLGVPDPGCASFVTAVRAVGEFLDESAGAER